jgi:hypothetical protein
MLMTNSANAIHIVLNPMKHAKTRNINIRYKWAIKKTKNEVFAIKHIAGTNSVADGLTKPLDRNKHQKFVR